MSDSHFPYVLRYLNSLEFNWITPYLYLYENQAQKFLTESSRTPECMLKESKSSK